jgi:misacylated tRNA(Ala) deacylase
MRTDVSSDQPLFRTEPYRREAVTTVTTVVGHAVGLSASVFYPHGGGQPGDVGVLTRADGATVPIIDTRKGALPDQVVHVLEEGAALPAVGETVTVALDWVRRYRHMRMHTCLHLLCSLVPAGVTGGQIGDQKSRLDFDLKGHPTPDKAEIEQRLNDLICGDHLVSQEWITDVELDAQADLVRTLSVKPPRGSGLVRLVRIGTVDLQPCGGTHVASTAEIGPARVAKMENKGKQNKRIVVELTT